MKTDSFMQGWILNELQKNYEIERLENSWKYENSCSPEYKSLVNSVLLLVCREPFKKQIANVITKLIETSTENLDIPGTVELYWGKFLKSIRIPNMSVVPLGNLNDQEELVFHREEPLVNREKSVEIHQIDTWDLVLEHLRLFEMKPEDLLQAMETDLSTSEDKELVKKMLCRCFQLMADAISDYALHDTYIIITNRMTEIAQKIQNAVFSQYLDEMLRAKSYKFDETEVIAQFLTDLRENEDLIKDFFNVKGSSLAELISKAIGLLRQFRKWNLDG